MLSLFLILPSALAFGAISSTVLEFYPVPAPPPVYDSYSDMAPDSYSNVVVVEPETSVETISVNINVPMTYSEMRQKCQSCLGSGGAWALDKCMLSCAMIADVACYDGRYANCDDWEAAQAPTINVQPLPVETFEVETVELTIPTPCEQCVGSGMVWTAEQCIPSCMIADAACYDGSVATCANYEASIASAAACAASTDCFSCHESGDSCGWAFDGSGCIDLSQCWQCSAFTRDIDQCYNIPTSNGNGNTFETVETVEITILTPCEQCVGSGMVWTAEQCMPSCMIADAACYDGSVTTCANYEASIASAAACAASTDCFSCHESGDSCGWAFDGSGCVDLSQCWFCSDFTRDIDQCYNIPTINVQPVLVEAFGTPCEQCVGSGMVWTAGQCAMECMADAACYDNVYATCADYQQSLATWAR